MPYVGANPGRITRAISLLAFGQAVASMPRPLPQRSRFVSAASQSALTGGRKLPVRRYDADQTRALVFVIHLTSTLRDTEDDQLGS